MEHIRQELSQFEEKLELQSFCDWLEAEEKLGRAFKEMVKNVLASADEDIFKTMNGVIIEIANKVHTVEWIGLRFGCSLLIQNVHTRDRDSGTAMMLNLFFFQLSSDIQAFIYSAIAKVGVTSDEEVYVCTYQLLPLLIYTSGVGSRNQSCIGGPPVWGSGCGFDDNSIMWPHVWTFHKSHCLGKDIHWNKKTDTQWIFVESNVMLV